MEGMERPIHFSPGDEDSLTGEETPKENVSVEESGSAESDSIGCGEGFNEPTDTYDSKPLDDKEEIDDLLAQEKSRSEDYCNRLIRMQADFENYRKRVSRGNEDLIKFANEPLIMALLPVIDNLELAFSVQNNDYEKLMAGMEMIGRQLQDILAKEGVEAIAAVGEPFDPEYHEAVIKEESGEHPDNTVTGELRRGYTHKGKVIRPSMVKVSG